MAAAYIKGVQQWDVAACVKHFAANNQETERLWVEVEVDEETLREIYLPAFYNAVKKGSVYTIMGAYNKLYGEHCCQSSFLLEKVLRNEWGFDGVVISDWGGVHDTEKAALSQLDIEMSVTSDFDDYFMARPLKEKIEAGEISADTVDQKVLRILKLMQKLHMFDGNRKSGAYNTEAHRRKTLETARESVILLKNNKNILPLKADKLKRILVVGENAQYLHASGGGSAEIKALYEISPLMGLKSHLGGNVCINYVQGYCSSIDEDGKGVQNENWQATSLENGGQGLKADTEDTLLKEKCNKLCEEAVRLAPGYDTVIYIGGLNHSHDSEGNDRKDMKLPYRQDILIQELLKAKKDTIIVMVAGSPVEMESWIEDAYTVVFSWYAGMEGGNALADILLGIENPSGKLPETFYKTHTDCSAHALGEFPGGKSVAYKEGRYVGYRYNDKYNIEPRFCFGYGLSYTQFAYTEPEINTANNKICCIVENTGAYDGSEVVQVYIRKNGSKFFQELKGFEKVFLKTGEKQKVIVQLEEIEEDAIYCIGSSSRDIRLKTGVITIHLKHTLVFIYNWYFSIELKPCGKFLCSIKRPASATIAHVTVHKI